MTPEATGAPLVILAAGGTLPVEVAEAARVAGRNVFVIGLEGAADPGLERFPHAFVKWGQIGKVEALVKAHAARDLLLIGTVAERPDYANIGVDFGTLRYLPRLIKAMIGGDDTVLGNFVKAFEERGYRIVGAHEVAPALVASAGHIAGPKPGQAMRDDARLALDAAAAIGALDIGQGAVAINGRVVALEAAEGTDAMLERVGQLRQSGRLRWQGRAGVFAKRAKPQQDIRVDMPVIGPATLEGVERAGLAGIVVEAGRVIIAERTATIALAERAGVFIAGEGGVA